MLLRFAMLLVARSAVSWLWRNLDSIGVPFSVRVIFMVLVVAAALLGAMWYWQESILYVPAVPSPSNPLTRMHKLSENPPGMRSPADIGIPNFEDVTLTASDGVRIKAWFLPARDPAATTPTILFAHENAGNMGLRLQEMRVCHVLSCLRRLGLQQYTPAFERNNVDGVMCDFLDDELLEFQLGVSGAY